jgi:hypothetical protein
VRALLLLLLLGPLLLAAEGDLDRALRDLDARERSRREAALAALASGALAPRPGAEAQRVERHLLRMLRDKVAPAERALAARALGRFASAAAFEPMSDRIAKERDDRVLAALAEAFAGAPEAAAAGLEARLRAAEDPLDRAALLRALGWVPGEAARTLLRAHLAREAHPCARAAAAHALARDPSREAIPPLLALVDEDDPGLVTAACESLGAITRRKFGRDPIRWKAWWEAGGRADPIRPPDEETEAGEGGGERPRRYAHEAEAAKRAEDGTNYWFGVPVRGKRVVFCADVSASMRYKLPLANDQLVRAVKGLPSDALFEVVFFNEWVMPWRGRLVHADPITKELLARHLPTLEIKSYTNLFDALERALSLDPEEVFVVSDGEPNRGPKILPRDILSGLDAINARKVPIHAVSVVRAVDGHDHVPLLREIAERSGGRYVERTVR